MPKKKELDNESVYDSLNQTISSFNENDDGILDYSEESQVTAPKAEEKIGFFAGLWNSITNWFKNLFKSAPKQEPAPVIVEEPKVEEVEDDPRPSDPDGARKWDENQAIREKLNNLEHRNMAFEKQVKKIMQEGPDEVRTYLAGASDFSFRYSNDTMDIGIENAKNAGKNVDTLVVDMVKESIKNAARDATVESIKETISNVFGRPDENHPSAFRNQLEETLKTGSDKTLDLLKNAKPDELRFLSEQYDEMIEEMQWSDAELPSFEKMLQTGLKQVEGHGLYEQKKAAREADEAFKGDSMEEWNHNLKSDLVDRVNFVFKGDAEFASSEFGKQLMDVIENGDARTIDKLRCFAPDNWKQLKEWFDDTVTTGAAVDASALKNQLGKVFDEITDIATSVENEQEEITNSMNEVKQNDVPFAEQSQATEQKETLFGNELDEMPDEPVVGPMNG